MDRSILALASESDLPLAAGGRVRLRTLIFVRWLAIMGQAATIFFVEFGLDFTLPLAPAMAAVGASALLNITLALGRPAAALMSDRGTAVMLAYDLAQLSALLYLTGGLENPFAVLLLVPVTISATILSRRSTGVLCALAIAAVSALALWHEPLPGGAPIRPLPGLHVVGVWIALSMGILFIAAYAGSVAEEARRMSDALSATQLALSREQRRAAVGALAASAAHELGTPLGTIAIVAREVARDLPPDSPLAEDAALLLAETARCREILARLATRTDPEDADPFTVVPVRALVEAAAAPHRRPEVAVDLSAVARDGAPGQEEPQVVRAPEIVYGLGSLIQNAMQFARERVEIRTGWDANEVEVTILDDGPGFSPSVLDRLGEPYLSTRAGDTGMPDIHMGLGVFIALTLLERTGARVEFANRDRGGAQVTVRWRRSRLEFAADRARAA